VAGKQIDVILLANIFEQIMSLRSEVRPRSVGSLVNSLHEFEGFREMITSATITTLIDLPFAFLFLFVIWSIGGWVVVVPLVAIPLAIFLGLTLQGALAERVRKVMMATTQKQAMLIETLSGMETVKTMRAEGSAQRKWEQTIGEIETHGLRAKLLSTFITNLSVFLQNLAVVMVVVVGVYQIGAHNISVGALIACSLLVTRAMMPFSQIAALMTRYYQMTSALRGIDNIMKLPVERPRGKSFVHRQSIAGNIEFRNVSFSYPEQEIGALNDVSFAIKAGERVGVIGRVGSGKTTLHKLLLGLYQPTQGSVWLDGLDVNQMDPAEIRHSIGYVPQDVHLFFGSVRDNIMMTGAFHDDEAMLRAARVSGVMDFVQNHPKGFDMAIGERGERLSGGQRQTIAVARALLTDPPILLLDEPTNSLDNRSEENFKGRLAEILTPRHTLLLITHRASLLSLVDRLIVLEGGRVIADGPKEQVLDALSGGKIRVRPN
jgi:ATP-binding cassette subfamily C protein LapB